ncbi:hypothetical protein KKI24_03395 [bacterium]|nr:hypothetical protein [bacterium]
MGNTKSIKGFDACALFSMPAFGQVSKFSLKYFPSAMNSGIKEILNLVIPFPLVTINVKEYLDVNTEIPAGDVPLKINKELEDVSLVVDGGSIHVKVKYSQI